MRERAAIGWLSTDSVSFCASRTGENEQKRLCEPTSPLKLNASVGSFWMRVSQGRRQTSIDRRQRVQTVNRTSSDAFVVSFLRLPSPAHEPRRKATRASARSALTSIFSDMRH